MKHVTFIAVVLLGTLSGCRSASTVPNEFYADEHRFVPSVPATETGSLPTQLQQVAFVEEAAPIHLPLVPLPEDPESATLAAPDDMLALEDLEAIAFQNNPTLAMAAARIDAARGRELQAGLFPNPVIGYHGTEIGNLGTAGQQGAFMSQRVIMGGKLHLDRAIAGMVTEEAHITWHAQQQRVLNDLRIRFFDALTAQRRVQLTRDLARIGDDLVRATGTLIDSRLATENELLQAEIRADEAHILNSDAHHLDEEAWRRMVAVAGVPELQPMLLHGVLDAQVPTFGWEDCYDIALGANPELAAAVTRLDRACLQVQRARREPIPDVDVVISVRHHNVTRSDLANVQVGFPIPVFDRNQGAICSAEAEWIAASNEVRRVELDLQDRLAATFRRYADARQQVNRYRERIVPRAKRSLDLVTRGYENGQVTYLELLTSQQTHLRVNLSYLESLQELRTSLALLEGQLLDGSLSRRP